MNILEILKTSISSGKRNMFKEIDEKYMKQKKEYEMYESYYEGKHWKRPGVETRSGRMAVDSVDTDKEYYDWNIPLCADTTDTTVNLVCGVNGVNSIFSNNKDIFDIRESKLVKELAFEMYVGEETFVRVYRGNDNLIKAEVLESYEVICLGENGYAIINEIEDKIVGYNLYIQDEMGVNMLYVYNKKGELLIEEELELCPIYKFELEGGGIETLIRLQDQINMMLVQEFEINKYHASPAFTLKNVSPVDAFGKKLNTKDLKISADSILVLGPDGEVKRVEGNSVTPEFQKRFDDLIKQFYTTAKLGGLKNEDLGKVQSGYAIELKLSDTKAFIKSIREEIKDGILKMMYDFAKVGLIKEEDISFEFSDMIALDKSDELDLVQKKIDTLTNLVNTGLFTADEAKLIVGI